MSHVGTALINPYAIFEKIFLKSGMRVADLGCGRTGHFVFPAAKAVGDLGIVYAVDVMKDVLENVMSRARVEGFDNVQAIWTNLELPGKTPIPGKSLDACFFVNALFLMDDKTSALSEAKRLLKEDGFLVVVDWAKKLGPLGPAPERMTNPQIIKALSEPLGFVLKESFEAGDYHYCVIMQKKG